MAYKCFYNLNYSNNRIYNLVILNSKKKNYTKLKYFFILIIKNKKYLYYNIFIA